MRVSFNQLKKMVDFAYTPSQLAEKMTHIGLEVKKVEKVGQLPGVVVGKILNVKKHPNADKLSIVEVDTGGKVLPLVCGAPNVQEGRYVPVALEGAKLPGGRKVRKATIRGVSSPGMICSEKELGLGEDHSGILLLPAPFPLGEKLHRALELEDAVIDFEVTSNRGDCFSVLGVAREIVAITGNQLKLPSSSIQKKHAIHEPRENLPPIHIKNPELCPFYAARIIKGVEVGPSPLWLRWKILLSGAKPVNNVVDVTNYVMFEMGQPLHPFDLGTIGGPKVVVRKAKEGEVLVTLDGKKRQLTPDMLTIADAKRPIALAGIMGGKETETDSSTKHVLLEAAYFNCLSVSKTSRELGLSSEASSRFERGVDPSLVEKALDRAAAFVQKIAGGEVIQPAVKAGRLPLERKKILFNPSRVNRTTGLRIPSSTSGKILSNLGFKVRENKNRWEVSVPPHRHDVEREIDLVEEVVRIYGYHKIGMSLPQPGRGGGKDDSGEKMKDSLRDILTGCGFYETIINPLTGKKVLQAAKCSLRGALKVRNPLSLQQKYLRPYLFPQLMQVASFNYNQEAGSFRLMHMGKVFAEHNHTRKESSHLAAVVVEEGFDFYRFKGIVEVIFERLGIEGVRFSPCDLPYLSGECGSVQKGKREIGFLGRVHTEICEKLKLSPHSYLFELDLDTMISLMRQEKMYRPLPRFPSVKRDLSVVIDKQVPAQQIKEYILKKVPHLEKIKFFDFYTGPHVPKGAKSLSFSLIFRHPQRTLTDREVDSLQDKIVDFLNRRWKARLRDK